MFCRNRKTWGYLKWHVDSNGQGWRYHHYPWWDGLIQQHLTQEELVSLFPSKSIDYIMFDIDFDPKGRYPTVEYRCKVILAVLDIDPLIYTSSDSGGMRICVFLDNYYRRADVLNHAHKILESASLVHSPGSVEIMAGNGADRLPFGENSLIVDPITLESLDLPLSQKIDLAWERYNSQCIGIDGLKLFKGKYEASEAKIEHENIVSSLFSGGLPACMTTNDALLALCREFKGRQGLSDLQAEKRMKEWIHKRHNGNSVRINDGRIDEVENQISTIVRHFDSRLCGRKRPKKIEYEKNLRIKDVKCICGLFDSHKDQLATYSLLKYVKNHGRFVGIFNNPSQLPPFPPTLPDTLAPSFSNIYVVGFLQMWDCEIPYKAFIKFEGFDKTRPNNTVEMLQRKGIMWLYRHENRSQHKCRTYRIFFDYDENSEGIKTFNEGLRKLKTKEQLNKDYGRYMSTIIRNGGQL